MNHNKAKAYSEPCRTSKMKLVVKIVNGFQPLTIFTKCFILDTWLGYKCNSGKFLIIISFRIISKITVNHENKTLTSTAQKKKFSIKDLVTFTEEILNGKLRFLCNVDWNSATDICFENFRGFEKVF